MIINKETADTVLLNSLRIFDSSGKVIVNVKSLDTDTLAVSLNSGESVTANDFSFYVYNYEDASALESVLEEDLLPRVIKRGSGLPRKSLDSEDTSPEHLLITKGGCEPVLVQCTNCSTHFMMIRGGDGSLWSTTRSNSSDKWLTAEKLTKDAIACDNCGEPVVHDEK